MTRYLLALVLLCACGGTSYQVDQAVEAHDLEAALAAYDTNTRANGHDSQALARVAGLVLETGAQCDQCDAEARAQTVVRHLRRAGRAGRPILARIAEGRLDWARVLALSALARHDEIAEAELYGLAHAPAGQAFMTTLIPTLGTVDGEMLAAFLVDEDHTRRHAAALQLAALGCVDSAQLLAMRFPDEPSVQVRSALVRAFASLLANEARTTCLTDTRSDGASDAQAEVFENAARAGLELALSDAEARVRVAAVRGLIQSDPAGIDRVTPWFSAPPTPSSIEAARVLLATHPELNDELKAAATAHLLHAGRGGAHQSSALLAWFSIDAVPMEALTAQLAHEEAPGAVFQLARLLIDESDLAEARLRALARPDTMVGLQAAVSLAEHGEEDAESVVYAALSSTSDLFRLVAVRYFAHIQATHILRPLLEDPAEAVRFSAAGGALRAWNRGY